jgi:hypothetical protein
MRLRRLSKQTFPSPLPPPSSSVIRASFPSRYFTTASRTPTSNTHVLSRRHHYLRHTNHFAFSQWRTWLTTQIGNHTIGTPPLSSSIFLDDVDVESIPTRSYRGCSHRHKHRRHRRFQYLGSCPAIFLHQRTPYRDLDMCVQLFLVNSQSH